MADTLLHTTTPFVIWVNHQFFKVSGFTSDDFAVLLKPAFDEMTTDMWDKNEQLMLAGEDMDCWQQSVIVKRTGQKQWIEIIPYPRNVITIAVAEVPSTNPIKFPAERVVIPSDVVQARLRLMTGPPKQGVWPPEFLPDGSHRH